MLVTSLIALTDRPDEEERYKSCEGLASLIRYGEAEDTVTLQVRYMLYACGPYKAFYRVDKVLYSESNRYEYYLNKEITLSFLNKGLESKLNNFVCKNNKYEHVFSGDFRTNPLGAGRLDVTDGELRCGNDDE